MGDQVQPVVAVMCGSPSWRRGEGADSSGPASGGGHRGSPFLPFAWVGTGDQVQPVVAVMSRVSFLPAWRGCGLIGSSRWWRSWRVSFLTARAGADQVQPVVAVIAGLLLAAGRGSDSSGPAGGGGHRGSPSCRRVGGGQADQVQPVVAVIAGLLPAVRAGGDRQITSSQSSRSSRISLSSRVGDWQRDDQVQPVVALMARPPSCGYAIGARLCGHDPEVWRRRDVITHNTHYGPASGSFWTEKMSPTCCLADPGTPESICDRG